MRKKRLVKVFAVLMAICLLTNYNLVFDNQGSVPGVEFGQRVEASSTNTFSDEYKMKIPKERNDGYKFDGYIDATFNVSGTISIEDCYVKQYISFKCDLKNAYNYNYIEAVYADVYINDECIGGNSGIDPRRISNIDGTCTFHFKYEIDRNIEDWADDNIITCPERYFS